MFKFLGNADGFARIANVNITVGHGEVVVGRGRPLKQVVSKNAQQWSWYRSEAIEAIAQKFNEYDMSEITAWVEEVERNNQ